MEGKGSFFNIVLLFILAFLALTLAALAGYIFLVAPSKDSGTKTVIVTQAPEKTYTDADFIDYELVTEKTTYNLKNNVVNADPNTSSPPIIQATVYLKCFIKLPKTYSVKTPALKLDNYKNEIKSLVSTYFMTVTKEEALNPAEEKETASKVLTKQINDLLNETEKEKTANIVYRVVFPEWSVY